MFKAAHQYTPITTLSELLDLSYKTDTHTATPLARWQNNGQVSFTDTNGVLYVTPYRPEIHDLLEREGYHEKGLYVPFSDGEYRPSAYRHLADLAHEACWAYTQMQAKEVANSKGIRHVNVPEGAYDAVEIRRTLKWNNHWIDPLVMLYLMNGTGSNIGTYRVVGNNEAVLVCDENGRTWLVTPLTGDLDTFVCDLFAAGYTVNA